MLFVYDLSKSEEWDRIVRTFQKYDVYYLSGYTKAFQQNGDGEPLLFFYEDKKIRGINVVMKRDISDAPEFHDKVERNQYYDLVTPYGYGGWLIEGEGDKEPLFKQYERWCLENQIVSEFVRFHPMLNNQNGLEPFYDVIGLGGTIAMDLSSPEIIWANITSKNRNMIRKAQKNGLQIYRAQNSEIYSVFKEIYDKTMDKDHAEEYYYFSEEFYQSIVNDLKNQAQVFYAQAEDGQIAAATIIIGANGMLNYHLSGSRYEYQRLAPTNLMLYEVALWGFENGYTSFHMGGGVGSKEDSLYSFKKAFYRGEPKRYYIGKKILNSDVYEKLTKMREGIKNPSFFPKYRG